MWADIRLRLLWKTHASGVDGLEAFGGNDIISFDKFGSLRKLGMADGELQTIQSHDLNELIYAVSVGEQGPVYVSLSNGIAMLSRGDLSQKLKFVENFGTPFTHLTTGKKF